MIVAGSNWIRTAHYSSAKAEVIIHRHVMPPPSPSVSPPNPSQIGTNSKLISTFLKFPHPTKIFLSNAHHRQLSSSSLEIQMLITNNCNAHQLSLNCSELEIKKSRCSSIFTILFIVIPYNAHHRKNRCIALNGGHQSSQY